jgi:Large ribosomal RNA subunit accumulation protein YceD
MIDGRPFSHTIPAASVPRTGQTNVLRVSVAQCDAIAAFLDIPSVESLDATVTITPARGGSFHVTGEVRASVHQLCGVSLEPFSTAIHEQIDVRLAPDDRLETVVKKEVERTLQDEDPPEPLTNGMIDIGALAVEALALGLDPYPRKPGIKTPVMGDNDVSESPFAALAALKKPSAS